MNKRDIFSLALKISSPHGIKKGQHSLLDGKRVVETVFGIDSNCVEYVLIDEKRFSVKEIDNMKKVYEEKLIFTDETFLKKIKQTKNSQGVLAIAKKPPILSVSQLNSNFGRCIYFDNVQNPENAGAIIRTGLAMGWNNFIFSHGSVSAGNTKFIRSSSGYVYKASIFEQREDSSGYDFFDNATVLVADIDGDAVENIKIEPDENIVLVVGNEGKGISSNLHEMVEHKKVRKCTIAMKHGIDSLCVSQAAAMLLYIFRS